MKTKTIIILAFCVPYTFLSIFEDAMFGTLFMYLVMFLCVAGLSVLSIKNKTPMITCAGILLSGVISTFLTGIFLKAEEWTYYFTPFTPQMWIFILTSILLLIHYFLVKIVGKRG